MNIKINKNYENNEFIMSIDYTAKWNIEDMWKYIATTEGLKNWFVQLSIDEKALYFDMENIHEIMPIIEIKENDTLYFHWDTAKVSFSLKKEDEVNHIYFKEEMPFDFPNITNDLGGWLVHMTRLEKIFNNEEAKDTTELVKASEEKIKNILKTF